MRTKPTLFAALLFGACAWHSSAQPAFDSSGDKMLNGTYYFRQVLYDSQSGDSESLVGNISFDGNGNYTLSNATILDAASGSSTPQSFSATGTYTIAASGEGFINAFNPNVSTGDQIIGLVSKGVFIGSSTENTEGYNDLFIAAPIGSTPATNATLSGSYQVAYLDATFPGDAILSFSADGNGNIGTVNASEWVEEFNSSGTEVSTTTPTQTLTGVTYSFSNGAAQFNFGGNNPNNLIVGTEILYISPDGNFIFGGSFNGFDMFVGVRNASSTPSNYQALYYQAGLNNDFSGFPENNGLDSYFGATNILPGDNIIADERDNLGGSEDYVYSDGYTQNGDGSAFDTFYQYWASQDGTVRIGYGVGPSLGINVAFQAPSLSPAGSVYLSPIGVVNAASNAPFTTFVSPGEFLTLYGSGLSSTTNSASVPFQKNLDGVVVTMNGAPVPIYFVSPNQVSVVVPFEIVPGSVAQIQVSNNGANSNTVTAFTGQTSVGVFTTDQTGFGIAAAERPNDNYSVVSADNPALIGEPISLFVSGMGAVSSQPADGAAAPSNPLSFTDAAPAIFLYDLEDPNFAQAAVSFAGLAPGFVGLYQINFTVPAGLSNNNTLLDIFSGSDSENIESYLPVSDGTSSARPAARSQRRPLVRRHRRKGVQHLLRRTRTASITAAQP